MEVIIKVAALVLSQLVIWKLIHSLKQRHESKQAEQMVGELIAFLSRV